MNAGWNNQIEGKSLRIVARSCSLFPEVLPAPPGFLPIKSYFDRTEHTRYQLTCVPGVLCGEQLHVRDALPTQPLWQGRRRRGAHNNRIRRGTWEVLLAPLGRDHVPPDEQGILAPPHPLVRPWHALSRGWLTREEEVKQENWALRNCNSFKRLDDIFITR